MPAIQTDFLTNITPTRAGFVPEMVEVDLISRNVETAGGILAGAAVAAGADDRGCILYAGSKYLGIAVMDRSVRVGNHFSQYASCRIIRKGPVVVLASVAVNPNDNVYVTSAGAFTNVASGNYQIPDAKWFTKTGAGALGFIWTGQGGLPAVLETRNIGFIGDSRAFLSFTNPGGRNTYYRNLGIASAVAAATVGSNVMPTTLINGVAGETSTQINARVPAHIAAMQAAGSVRTFYIGTTNDRTGGQITVAQSKANVLAAIQMYNDAGISVDLISETPRGNGSSSYELSAQGKIDHKAMHDWMESLAGTNPKLTVHNWWDTWVDPASGSNYYVLAGVTEDGIHPSKVGAYLGSLVSGPKLLAETGNLPSILPTDNTLYNATTAPQGSLINNPMLTGTTGTKESGASAITGTVPTGWVLGATNIAGLTIAASLEVIGSINYFKLRVTGTGTSVNGATPPVPQSPLISLKQAVPLTNIANGDSVRSVGSVITAGTGISNAGLGFLLVPAYAVKYDTEDSAPSLPYPTVNTGRRSRETPPYVHDGSQTQYELRCEFACLAGVAVDATFWLGTVKTFKG